MSVVTADDADLFRSHSRKPGGWTVDDLALLPDDGLRYELLDGQLVVSPAPFAPHQFAVGAIYRALSEACPSDLVVIVAPFDFQPTGHRSFQPDVLVARRSDVAPDAPLHRPPVLAVEVLSESSRTMDLLVKPQKYAGDRVDHYWTFDPRALEFVAYRRKGQMYVEAATAKGDELVTIDEPYRVEICPADISNG